MDQLQNGFIVTSAVLSHRRLLSDAAAYVYRRTTNDEVFAPEKTAGNEEDLQRKEDPWLLFR